MLTAHFVAQIRAAEEVAAGDVGWDALMQSAADGLADHLLELLPPTETAVVLVGPGNNGGDALFAAARLCERGRRVNLCLLDDDAVHAEGLRAASAAGAVVIEQPEGHRYAVDAVFGIGARAGLTGRAAEWAAWVDRTEPVVIAVDVPSGIGVDDGTLAGPAIRADHTVTFGAAKPGLLLGPASALAGSIHVVDIGLRPRGTGVEVLEATDGWVAAGVVPGPDAQKYARGVLGVSAGSSAYAGAAHLCVAGAQAGPVGMIRFSGSQDLSRRVVDRAPEVVAATGRVQAWVVGPGGQDDPGVLAAALADEVPAVIDATALGHLPEVLRPDVLLTPHAGELASMLGREREAVQADPLTHARLAAERWNATVLIKGRRTVVVAPDGRVRVNTSGTPWLATAGSGDVLAGLAGSLLASGLDALDAGSLAALLHGLAAERLRGPFVASDLARVLPAVFADFCDAGAVREPDREHERHKSRGEGLS